LYFPPLTRKSDESAGRAPARQPGETIRAYGSLPAFEVAVTPLADRQVNAASPGPPSPGSGNCAPSTGQIQLTGNWTRVRFPRPVPALPCKESAPASRGRTAIRGHGRPTRRRLHGDQGRSRALRRHEAGGRPPAHARDLPPAARPLHSPHSADSRSRPPRPSRHIRDTGPDGVRERRAPLTGVRYPLCYLGWSRLEVGRSSCAPLSRPPFHP